MAGELAAPDVTHQGCSSEKAYLEGSNPAFGAQDAGRRQRDWSGSGLEVEVSCLYGRVELHRGICGMETMLTSHKCLVGVGKGGVELTFLAGSGAMGDVFCGLEGETGRRLESYNIDLAPQFKLLSSSYHFDTLNNYQLSVLSDI